MTPTPSALADGELQRLLDEDVRFGDLTTDALGIVHRPGVLTFSARDAMTVCGTEEAARLFALCGASAELQCPSGRAVAPGTLLLTARGPAGALHRGWNTAQTLVEWAAGIATAAAGIVAAARCADAEVMVAGTRKNVPGSRALAAKALRAGGAIMHRLGLSETLLVFAEHRRFLGDESPAATLDRLRRTCPEKRVVVEVGSLAEALAWAGCDVLQLEKFSPAAVAEVRAALAAVGSRALLAAAGGINAANAEAYVRAGARLLVTSAPHTAPPRDVQVHLAP